MSRSFKRGSTILYWLVETVYFFIFLLYLCYNNLQFSFTKRQYSYIKGNLTLGITINQANIFFSGDYYSHGLVKSSRKATKIVHVQSSMQYNTWMVIILVKWNLWSGSMEVRHTLTDGSQLSSYSISQPNPWIQSFWLKWGTNYRVKLAPAISDVMAMSTSKIHGSLGNPEFSLGWSVCPSLW